MLYIDSEYTEWQADMLRQAYEMRALVVLFDGIDEAAGLCTVIENFLICNLARGGTRVVCTSRPEGVRLELYHEWVLISLSALSEEQRRDSVAAHLARDSFFSRIFALTKSRTAHDELYYTDAFGVASLRGAIETIPDLDFSPTSLSTSHSWTRTSHGGRVVRALSDGEPPNSAYLKAPCYLLLTTYYLPLTTYCLLEGLS